MARRLDELQDWIEHVSGAGWQWYVKYIAANDTYAKSNVHQGGPYLGKDLLRAAFPELTARASRDENPDMQLPAFVRSHGLVQDVRLIWYNSKRLTKQANGRDEARLTRWGGAEHPLVAADATGSMVVFAFHQASSASNADGVEVWITESSAEVDELLEVVGPVDPGAGVLFSPAVPIRAESSGDCTLRPEELRAEWRDELPSGEDILAMVLDRQPRLQRLAVDSRLIKRRSCEYQLFQSIENHVVLPRVRGGFDSVESFVRFANSVTNRRKSRAGKSLELQVRAIFQEEAVPHSWTEPTEAKRIPDFIFPSISAYRDKRYPAKKLRMLAAKTTCKDRWRQILNEAARIPTKHLLTLQEGVSTAQFAEMQEEGVRLVVPSPLHDKYPDEVREHLVSLGEFVHEVKGLE